MAKPQKQPAESETEKLTETLCWYLRATAHQRAAEMHLQEADTILARMAKKGAR